MDKKDMRAILVAAILSGAAFVVPVKAEETINDPVPQTESTTQNEDISSADEDVSSLEEVKNGWSSDGYSYYENGVMVVNDFRTFGDGTYYFGDDGRKYNYGYAYIGNDGYYFNEDGVMQINYLQFEYTSVQRYFGADGKMVKNQLVDTTSGKKYFDENGNVYFGIKEIGNDLYYFGSDSTMQYNVEYGAHYFGADGKAVKNQWKKLADGYKYYNEQGVSFSCENYSSSYWPMIEEIDGKYYAFNMDGYMVTGWVSSESGVQYYFKADGSRASNEWVDNKKYYVGYDGQVVKNAWIDNNSYVGEDGQKTKNTWEQNDGKWQYLINGEMCVMSRMMYIDGYYYVFDDNGNMLVNTSYYVSNSNYDTSFYGLVHANKDGHLIKGWYQDQYKLWYYFGNDYKAYSDGLYTIADKQYYFKNNNMVTSSTFVENGNLYKADANGVVTLLNNSNEIRWIKSGYGTYYMKNGTLLKSTMETIDGVTYYFSSDGSLIQDMSFEYNGIYYYANEDGCVIHRKNSWYQNDYGQWYYFGKDGNLVQDCIYTIGNARYAFDVFGNLKMGAISAVENSQLNYYLTDSMGRILTTKGWKMYNFKWYYIQNNGTLLNHTFFTENGKTYYFDDDSSMVSAQVKYIDNILYYFDTQGVLNDSLSAYNGWKKFHGIWYYVDNGNPYFTGNVDGYYVQSGKMVTNQIIDDCYVGLDGNVLEGWIHVGSQMMYGNSLRLGKLVKNQWLVIGDKWYYFQGYYMVTGYHTIGNILNRFTDDGLWLGTVKSNSWYRDPKSQKWLYVGKDGYLNSQLKVNIDGKTYYFTLGEYPYVYLAENTLWYDAQTGESLWTNKTGTGFDTSTGWKKTKYGYYAYCENGKLVTGIKTINGKTYYFGQDGYLICGVTNYKGKAYVQDANGNVINYKEGWNVFGKQWFYIQNGRALMNTSVDGYYIGSDGLTFTGILGSNVLVNNGIRAIKQWVKVYDEWYYGDANGHILKNQWLGNYYFDEYGCMATNRWIDNYYVGADGLYRPSQWIKSNGKWWYRYQDGSYVASAFDTIDGKTYFFDPDGYMITGWARINEKYYYFNQSGHMVTNAWVDDCYLESDGVRAENKWIGKYHVNEYGKWDMTR